MLKNYSSVDSPETGSDWKNMKEESRKALIKKFIDARSDFSNLEKENGQIIIMMLEALPASRRGLFLLNFEKSVKITVDEGITVWCEPVGDKSKLRALRGVNITT
jgi:hypothetical protein